MITREVDLELELFGVLRVKVLHSLYCKNYAAPCDKQIDGNWALDVARNMVLELFLGVDRLEGFNRILDQSASTGTELESVL